MNDPIPTAIEARHKAPRQTKLTPGPAQSIRQAMSVTRAVVNDALRSLDTEFDRLYAGQSRPSIAPERLIRPSLLQILYSIRSERQFMEPMDYSLLFHWFVGLGVDDVFWVPAVFKKNRTIKVSLAPSQLAA